MKQPKQSALPLEGETRLFHESLAVQVGGTHYKNGGVEPYQFAELNGFPPSAFNIFKYLVRYESKGGREDLEKAQDYARKAIALYDRCALWKGRTGDDWTIIPAVFIASNHLTGNAAKAVTAVCSVFTGGLAQLIEAERCITALLAEIRSA